MAGFNIRVYGILLTPNKEILVADELIRGAYFTKFPGGGLEFGEGTRDCLKREFKEEMNLEVKVTDHIYTTDFYQESVFKPGDQIISIYYFVEALEPVQVPVRTASEPFEAGNMQQYFAEGQSESFRYISLDTFSAEDVTLPIDKIVSTMVKQGYLEGKW
ncbi:NUDIX domain-containing protein [Pseudoflavitalea sp. G-6-1-2]|uniref:NUDIX domain-containing protein n=1 Tax=Pseudoflavitalea sp. G-6-1-2 TaxID=2728841 RepID=UPI00146DE6F4|nr:NUDIX domain-containing protein [Pseudoflavitalea sp. G-6-1-2]NML22460.1 NUDIX domain-containing protein [Pseudoflavitalea sp. G-6-1-2]